MTDAAKKIASKKIEDRILELLHERKAESSICPSEVARSLSADDWRDLMDGVRQSADRLVDGGKIIVTQKGRKVSSAVNASGPIRLKLIAG